MNVATRFRVALADAFHDEAEMYAASLTHYGFDVRPIRTEDLSLAVDTICRLRPDAVITRILPGRFGIDLVRRLRADATMAPRPIVILTSLTHSDILCAARACGATEVMLLPIGAEVIAARLRHFLRSGRRTA
jgi:DNA-binding response OmpR family regulator